MPFVKGRPQYHTGKVPIWVPKASRHYKLSSWVSPKLTKVDLVRFICKPEKSAKRSSSVDRFLASSTKPSMKNVASSMYCRSGIPSG